MQHLHAAEMTMRSCCYKHARTLGGAKRPVVTIISVRDCRQCSANSGDVQHGTPDHLCLHPKLTLPAPGTTSGAQLLGGDSSASSRAADLQLTSVETSAAEEVAIQSSLRRPISSLVQHTAWAACCRLLT